MQEDIDKIAGIQRIWRRMLQRRAAVVTYMNHLPSTVQRKDTVHIRVSDKTIRHYKRQYLIISYFAANFAQVWALVISL